MRAHWITAALFSTVLAAACGGGQSTANTEEAPPALTPSAADASIPPPADPVSPPADTAVPAATKPSAKSPAPSRPAAAAPPPAAAPKPAPPAPPPAPRIEYRTLTVPANTPLALELLTPLSSETTTLEAPVRARLKQAVSVSGLHVLPAGTVLAGNVTDVAQAGRVKGRSRIAFAFTEATVAGAKEKLHTNPIVFEGEATKSEDATKIGVGAGVGAVIGGIVGGGSGAATGAAIGGAAGTGVVLATKGKDVKVAEGADIAATLSEPFNLRVRVE